MPKQAADARPERAKPRRVGRRAKWVQQRTRSAAEYYAQTKKEDLQDAKAKYLLKLGVQDLLGKSVEAGTEKSVALNESLEEAPSYALRKSTLSRECSYREESPQLSEVVAVGGEGEGEGEGERESSEEEGEVELREVHHAALEVQKIIDSFVDFHWAQRGRRSVGREELLNFLRTTKYCLNSEKYIALLLAYNRSLFRFEDGRLFCGAISSEERERRWAETKRRMGRRRVEGALLMFH